MNVRILPDTDAADTLEYADASSLVGESLPVVSGEELDQLLDQFGVPSFAREGVELAVYESGRHPAMDTYGPLPIYDGEYEIVNN